jgi:hypothetical protein
VSLVSKVNHPSSSHACPLANNVSNHGHHKGKSGMPLAKEDVFKHLTKQDLLFGKENIFT